MANKKLKVELDIETAQAKRQLGELGGSSGGGSTATSRASEELTKATQVNTRQMLTMTRAFSGLALGLAASYSANYFKKGSTEETALGYAGSILSGGSSGAMMGAALGPHGALAGALGGALIGGLKEFFDRDGAKTKATEDFDKAEAAYARNEDFSGFLKRITSPFNPEDVGMRLARLGDKYRDNEELIAMTIDSIRAKIADGELDEVARLRELLGEMRGRKKAIMSTAEQLDNNVHGPAVASRAALDSLMKIGGGFGLPLGQKDLARVTEINGIKFDQHGIAITKLLEDIRANTMKGSSTWQN